MSDVLDDCPTCDARHGYACRNVDGDVVPFHDARLRDAQKCSRCSAVLPHYEPHAEFTAGYYVVQDGYWARFFNPGELFLCDACMWTDPAFRAERGQP